MNPDFGQVEVDPAVVNLSAFETFYPEKRPFFLEGSQIFGSFGSGGANSFWGFNSEDPLIFYSRRIGRAPQLGASADFADIPGATTILGATKLTGKTRGGWSIGAARGGHRARDGAHADRSAGRAGCRGAADQLLRGARRTRFGARAGIGFLTTAVTRRLDTAAFEHELAQHAYVAGADAIVFFDDDARLGRHRKGLRKSCARIRPGTSTRCSALRSGTSSGLMPLTLRSIPRAPRSTGVSGRVNSESQQRDLAGQRRAVGCEPGVRVERPRLPQQGRSGRRARRLHVAKCHARRFTRARTLLGRQSLDVELQSRAAERRLVRVGLVDVPQLLGVRRGPAHPPTQTLDDRLTRGGPSVAQPAQQGLGYPT